MPLVKAWSDPVTSAEVQFSATVTVLYFLGPHGWPLPAVEVPYPPGLDAFRWFGRRFLEGLVCSKMGCLLEHLFVNPAVMVKSWAK